MDNVNISKEFLYDKTYKCPVCESYFKAKAVRSGKARLISKDSDFMPRYQNINPLYYDVIICPKCGYGALIKYFDKIKSSQCQLIREKVTSKFKPRIYPDVYDVDIAIERHKLALVNTIVKNARVSEEAYTCPKIAWLYRIKGDNLNELKFLMQSLTKFKEAYEKEPHPICGMNTFTLTYLIGELERRCGNNENALQWFGKVIVNPGVNSRLKELARDQKDLIKENTLNRDK